MDRLKVGNPVTTDKLIHRLRLMAGAGGMITRDRMKTIMEAADRLELLDERIAIMEEGSRSAQEYTEDERGMEGR